MSLYLGNTVISGVTTPVDGSIAIGQIISSIIPLTDAGLHLLDGSVIQGGGIYDAFVQYIANLVNIYPQCFTDETTWQNTVGSKGACGKFVYDSTNNTVRLPKITGFIEGTVDSSALGELVDAGLPNITHTHTRGSMNITGSFSRALGMITNQPITGTGAFSNGSYSQSSSRSGTNESYWQSVNTVNFNAANNWTGSTSNNSDVSSIYGNSSTVQPQSIKVFYYIVIATTTKTDIEVDIDDVITDLNSKANDADVVHKTGNETIGGSKLFEDALKTKGGLDVINDSIIKGTIPATTKYWGLFRANDANYTENWRNTRLGIGEVSLNTTGDVQLMLGVYKNEASSSENSTISIKFNANGTKYVTAPASDVNNSIVTTVNKSKATNGYFKLGNGLIIQWGQSSLSANTATTITLPKAFTSTNYKVTSGIETNDQGDRTQNWIRITDITTTNFKLKMRDASTLHWIAIGY